mgnify:CR=1 FL=1
MDMWIIWFSIGIICIIIEIFTPGFIFMSFGIGAILTGFLALKMEVFWVNLLFYIIVTFLLFISLSRLSKKYFSKNGKNTNVSALINQTGIVQKDILPDEKGCVKVGGEEWSAISKDSCGKGVKVVVMGIDGNKLIVEKNRRIL